MDFTNNVGMDAVPSGLAMATGGFFLFNFLLGIVMLVVGIVLIVRMFKAMRHIEEIRNMMERMESKKTMPVQTMPIKKPVIMAEKKAVTPIMKKTAPSVKAKK